MSSPKATTAAAATPAKSTAVVRYTSPSGSTSSASSSRRSSNSGSYTQNSRSYTQSSYSYPQSSYGYAQSSYSYPQSSTSTSSPTTMAVAPTYRHPMSMTASAPNCVYCGDPTERFVTRASNRNGNAGRPYYKCVPCKKFAVFADERGNSPNNPPCEGCGMPSKRQVAGRNSTVPGGIHYVCSQGTCDFYQPHVDRSGVQAAVLDPDLLKALINLNLV